MQPCIVCGTEIRKKNSVMTAMYICSIICKANRKQNLPKKLSHISFEFWMNKGYSEIDAKQKVSELQTARTPRSVIYWMNKGYSEIDAKQKVSELQSSFSKLQLVKYSREERLIRTPFSRKYWMKKGYTEIEAVQIISKRSDNLSLAHCIDRYGEVEGAKAYTALCNTLKQSNSIDGYINKHGAAEGNRLWSKKYKNRHNSEKANIFLTQLEMQLPGYKIYTAGNSNGEYGVLNRNNNQYYFYDFVVPELKICIEYNGDYWHCNPKKYNADYIHKQSNRLAKDIWESDKQKQECLLKERGFDTIIVWESDIESDALTLIMEKINEFRKNQN